MRISRTHPARWIVSMLLITARPGLAQEVQKATILSHRFVNVVEAVFDNNWRASDPAVARGIVLAVKFEPSIPELTLSDLAVGFGADAKEGTSPNLGATYGATDTKEGFWLLNDLKAGKIHVFKTPTEHTHLLFGLPNDVKDIKLFYKKTAVSGPMRVNR